MGYNYKVQRLKQLPFWGACALMCYMPFHIFLSQWLGTSLGALSAWKVAKDIAIILLTILTILLSLMYLDYKQWRRYRWLVWLSGAYAGLHILVYLFNRETSLRVAGLASTYNNRFIWVFLVIIFGALLAHIKPNPRTVVKVTLIISTILCVLGMLQWVLPKDILTHFGYAKELGVKPNFFINEDPAFPRVFATIRDPNSFGATLIIPILFIIQSLRAGWFKRRLLFVLLSVHLLALYLSFSRAAWGGLLIAGLAYAVLTHKEQAINFTKRFWPVMAAGLIVMAVGLYQVRSTPAFRSIVLRADDKNAATELDSDEYHLYFIEEGIRSVADRPEGYGPGTAGNVSIQTGENAQLTENYYVQIAHEVGIIGLAIFLAIWGIVIYLLWHNSSPLREAMIAAAAAFAVMAMVMHLWTNEAVAYTWWGLAALALVTATPRGKKITKSA
jgi:hypothetical protein